MQEVAEVAGVSPGSLYQYFADREALVAEIIERISAREVAFQTQRLTEAAAAPTLEDAVRALLAGTLEFQRQEGPLMRAALEAMPQVGRHHALVQRVQQVTLVLRRLIEAHRGEIIRPDLDVATHVLVNALHAVSHEGALPRPATLDDATLEGELVALALGYLTESSPRERQA